MPPDPLGAAYQADCVGLQLYHNLTMPLPSPQQMVTFLTEIHQGI